MACVIYITMYGRPHDRGCLPWVFLHMDDMDLVTWPSKRQLRWFWRQVCGRYFERWEFMTLLCIQQKSGSSWHDIFMYITKPIILPVNILMLVTEVCSQYFVWIPNGWFYTLPVILIFVCRLSWYLCRSAHDNVVVYITKFNISITMIISIFEDRGMWLIFLCLLCDNIFMYVTTSFFNNFT